MRGLRWISARKAVDLLAQVFVPGVTWKHGLDDATIAAANPSIVDCSISGYVGQTGPLRDRPAFAHLINAASGAMDLDRQGRPSRAWPTAVGRCAGGRACLRPCRCGRQSGARRIGTAAYDISMLQTLWAAEDIGIAAALERR
jgi:hypothetical protein